MALPPKKKGIGVMIAIGRPKDAPQPPKGMKDAPGAEADMPDEPDHEPDGDEGGSYKVNPETVGYHQGPEPCSECAAFANGQCKLLQMEVGPDDGCYAFQPKESGEMDEGSGMGGDTDAGSGNGMMG